MHPISPIFDHFFQHFWPYLINGSVYIDLQYFQSCWFVSINHWFYISPKENNLEASNHTILEDNFIDRTISEITLLPNCPFNKLLVSVAMWRLRYAHFFVLLVVLHHAMNKWYEIYPLQNEYLVQKVDYIDHKMGGELYKFHERTSILKINFHNL